MSVDRDTTSGEKEPDWYMPAGLRFHRVANTVLSVIGGTAFVLMRVAPEFWSFSWLLCITVTAVVGVVFVQSLKIAVRRSLPFCIHCGYSLQGLADNHRCPECGEPYTFADCAAYHRDPVGYRRRWEKKEFEKTTQVVDSFWRQQRERQKRRDDTQGPG